jgi:hypothetical protein
LPGSLVKDLVAYAVSRVKIQCTSALKENIAPQVAFTGMPVQYQKELRFAFGYYVEAHKGTDNMSRPRSATCIAQFLIGNSTGSWQQFKIASCTKVRRTNMVKFVTSGLVIDAVNAIAEEEAQATSGSRGILEVGDDQKSADNEAEAIETPNGNPEEIRPEVQQQIPMEIPPNGRKKVKKIVKNQQKSKLKMKAVRNLVSVQD